MSNHSYEVEIKSLLGSGEEAKKMLERMRALDPNLQSLGSHKQLNHYFIGGNLRWLFENIEEFLEKGEREKLQSLVERAKDFSLRTRQADGDVLLVLKISVDEGTSANTVGRIEFEARTPNLTLEELDKLVEKASFQYQAKWSRERTEYQFLDTHVTIDKNAGYGHLAEFEVMVKDPDRVNETKARLRNLVAELELEELDQARLERMFAFYNANWQDYYGTEKVFVIE